LAKLDEQIADLQRAQQSLDKLAAECAKGGSRTCPILVAFEV
jgi:MerR family transcriptional regulator, mercuric resistance operon regulatory protein